MSPYLWWSAQVTGLASKPGFLAGMLMSLIVLLGMLVAPGWVLAVEGARVDELDGRLEAGQIAIYDLAELKRGDRLYVYAEGTSRGFDPLIALLRPGVDTADFKKRYAAMSAAPDNTRQPLAFVNDTLNELSLAWNDDYQGTYHAVIEVVVPQDGIYQLALASSIARKTEGKYRLLVGIGAPQVLSGKAMANVELASLRPVRGLKSGVEVMRGTLSAGTPFEVFHLGEIDRGDELYVYAEATSGDLRPVLELEDFGFKPMTSSNVEGKETVATLTYKFDRDTAGWRIRVAAGHSDDNQTAGDFRLIIGFNDPAVLRGEGERSGRAVLRQSIFVNIGAQIHQIVAVDQQSENFTIVGDLLMEWDDPNLAYVPDPEQPFKLLTGDSFHQFTNAQGILWPKHIVSNQQGRRALKGRIVGILPDGHVVYVEQFTATLQAPDFDFRRYPFDKQRFFLSVDMMLPRWFFIFEEADGFSQVGGQLGEEEWIVGQVSTSISAAQYASRPVSRFTLDFQATRHLNYYVFRIFFPMLIIITVSWVLFFLRDYTKRVDVASANLLLFIAFNFTISNDLPRLGYLTLLDMFLISTFMVTGLVLVLSVLQKRMETDGLTDQVRKIDKYVLMLYPFAYGIAVLTVWLILHMA